MRFEEQVKVPVSLAEAWAFLWQTQRVAACLPGCQAVEEVEPGKAYRAQFADAIGPYKASFDMDVAVQEARPPELIVLQASGQDKRLGASQQTTLRVALRGVAPQVTVLDVTADVQVLGKIAALGQFAIKRKAKDVVERFARNVAQELERTPSPNPLPPQGAGAPAQATPAIPPPSPSRGEGGRGR
ncbi:MAG TPA: SRPBCC domain-containing protein [Chloroflexota bacterium]